MFEGYKNIAVLAGGPSAEKEISLRSGKKVLEALLTNGYSATLVNPDEPNFIELISKGDFDVAFIALHGAYGEDGVVQGLLESLKIPYTGSGVEAHAIGFNKITTKLILQKNGIPTPEFQVLENPENLQMKNPFVLKPAKQGSSFGITMYKEHEDLENFQNTFLEDQKKYGRMFAEKFIPGTEVTAGIVGGQNPKVLSLLELKPVNDYYDYEAKYTPGMTKFILPATIPDQLTQSVKDYALATHLAIGCFGFSRVDFIVSDFGQPFVTEINTIPGLTDQSDLPAMAEYDGISYEDMIEKILMTVQENSSFQKYKKNIKQEVGARNPSTFGVRGPVG
jgi:D-alanine-D-alanine ligase